MFKQILLAASISSLLAACSFSSNKNSDSAPVAPQKQTATLASKGNAANNKPNVIVIMTDEHNFRTIGAYRDLLSKEQAQMWGPTVVETPNIDWLADNGAISTSYYSSAPVCTPARGSFFSGMYPQNNGAVQNNQPLREDAITYAHILNDQGYATGYIGKWHLDGPKKPYWAPEKNFGFKDNRYMYNRGHWKQFEDTKQGSRVPAVNSKGKPTYSAKGATERSYSTDYQFDKMIEFIDTNKHQPFMMTLSLSDPHGPDSVRAPYDTMYQHVTFKTPRTNNVKKEDAPLWAQPGKSDKETMKMHGYYGMVKLIDDSMGRLYAKLRQENLLEKTIIIFTSDHGDLKGEHGRQNKGNPFEGSARIPFLVYYPGKVLAKTVVPQAMTTTDFQQTLLGLMDIQPSGNEDGRDASGLFTGETNTSDWLDMAFMRQSSSKGEGWIAVLTDRYKLVFDKEDQPWLFDLEKDPDELINFYRDPAYKSQIQTMSKALKNYAHKYNDVYYLNNDYMQQQVEAAIQ